MAGRALTADAAVTAFESWTGWLGCATLSAAKGAFAAEIVVRRLVRRRAARRRLD
jgi:uncharacterized membrane protein